MTSAILFGALLGLIVGSFLNVLVLRLGTGRSPWRGRSECLVCARTLRWFELVPLVSYLALRGRCRQCGSRLSVQYPLVEAATGLIFGLAIWRSGLGLEAAFLAAALALLVAIFVYDLRHKIIPDSFVYVFNLAALARLVYLTASLERGANFWFALWPSLATALICFLFFWALWYFSRGAWVGFGDAKLVFGLALLLPPAQAVTALILAFWLGAAVGLALVAAGKMSLFGLARYYTIKSELPFAPFLILGSTLVIFLPFDVFFF